MKIHVSLGGKFVVPTLQAGAALLLNQPTHRQTVIEAVSTDIEQHDNLAFEVAPITPTSAGAGTIIREVVVPVQPTWDRATKRRFKALAVKEALDEILPDEKRELESLMTLRRREEPSVDPEHIIWEYKQRKLTNELVTLLEKYVEFHRPRENASRRQTPKAKG